MTNKARYLTMAWRWSIFTTLLVAAFWAIWHHFAGSVPVAREIVIWPSQPGSVITLPFAVSRWWDVLAAPIYSYLVCLFIWMWASPGTDQGEDNWKLIVSVVIPFIVGAIFAVVVTLAGITQSMIVAAVAAAVTIPSAAILAAIVWCCCWLIETIVIVIARPVGSFGRWLTVRPKATRAT